MKKQTKLISIVLIFVIVFSSISAFAIDNDSMLSVTWQGNYMDAANPTLSVSVVSSAGYTQTVLVAMYDDAYDAQSTNNKPTFSDYYRMGETVVSKDETKTVIFDITNTGTPLADGVYNVLVQGSGKDSALSRVQIPVCVIRPSDIPGLIAGFNSCDETGVKSFIDKVKRALQLTVNAQEPTTRLSAFVSIRDVDYEGNFVTLHDVEKAWGLSEILSYLSDSDPDKTAIKGMFEKNASFLGIDITNSDYKANASDIYDAILHNNTLSKPQSISDIKNVFDECLAISVFNNSTNTTISKNLAEYYDEVGISEEAYKLLVDCIDSETKLKIERMFVKKDFKTAQQVRDTFKNAVDSYLDVEDTDSDNTVVILPGGNGGNGGGGGGAFTPVKGLDSNVPANAMINASFKDCPKDHWAYSYVEELKQTGIISGYADGTFGPDNTVKREEFVKMIVLLSGINNNDSKCIFDDVVNGEWYYSYVASAFENGIINGTSDKTFGIGANISRQDVAVIVARLLTKLGVDTDISALGTQFKDEEKISNYAADSIKTLTVLKVLNGFEDGTFRPYANLTRAEAAKIISLIKTYIR